MIGTLCAAAAVIFFILFLFAILNIFATLPWVTLLVLAIIFAVLAYFLGGFYGRRGRL